jgi:preprotein translocase subunit SecE
MADKIKLLLAILVLGGAIGAFYYYGDQSLLLRVLGLVAAAGIATAILAQTEKGAAAIAFSRGSVIEVRKVVWPTRKETTQTTLIVVAMVVVMGIVLWLFDSFLLWAVSLLTGQGS